MDITTVAKSQPITGFVKVTPDGAEINNFNAVSNNPSCCSIDVSPERELIITPLTQGTATILVTCTSRNGTSLSAQAIITVTESNDDGNGEATGIEIIFNVSE